MDLSVVIPAFNEEKKIGRDVEAAAVFFSQAGFSGEVIVVDDGSEDRTTETARGASINPGVVLKVIRLEKNSGKGAAVKEGVLRSTGEVVLYADSGTCIPYQNAARWIEKVGRGGLDMAMASRRLKETVICRDRPLKRRLLARLFHQAAVAVAGLPSEITDSQCGFKIYKGEMARELFSGLETSGFLFELEIILKALKKGFRLEEFPVEWTCDLDTRLRPAAHSAGVLKELLRIRSIIKRYTKEVI